MEGYKMSIVKSNFTCNYYITHGGHYFCGFYSDRLPVWGDYDNSKPFSSVDEAKAQSFLLNLEDITLIEAKSIRDSL